MWLGWFLSSQSYPSFQPIFLKHGLESDLKGWAQRHLYGFVNKDSINIKLTKSYHADGRRWFNKSLSW